MLLPRLARLVWFREAYIPDWLRKALLEHLSPVDEATTRALLHAVLASLTGAPGQDDSAAHRLELATRKRTIGEAAERRARFPLSPTRVATLGAPDSFGRRPIARCVTMCSCGSSPEAPSASCRCLRRARC